MGDRGDLSDLSDRYADLEFDRVNDFFGTVV